MNKKLVLSTAFLISLAPMLLCQYGGCRGVQELSGLLNLCNPIGVLSVLIFFAGAWLPLTKKRLNTALCVLGSSGVVASEVYTFFTWHIRTISGKLSLQASLRLTYPEFYIGLVFSLLMVAACFVIEKYVSTDTQTQG